MRIIPVPVEVEVVEFSVAVVDVCGRSMVFVEGDVVDPDTVGELKVTSGVEEETDVILADISATGVVESPQLEPYPQSEPP